MSISFFKKNKKATIYSKYNNYLRRLLFLRSVFGFPIQIACIRTGFALQ
jgi:hypothetical protein